MHGPATVTLLFCKVKTQMKKENLIRIEANLKNLYAIWAVTDKIFDLKL